MTKAFYFVIFCALFSGSTAMIPCTSQATYTVVNKCNWNKARHPKDYPSGAHFSPLCGTVHNGKYSMWKIDGESSPGVKSVAETGFCATLLSEVTSCQSQQDCPNNGYFNLKCQVTGATGGVCTHSGSITVSYAFRKVSMLSMLAPSPDWIVGLDSVDLCVTDAVTGQEVWVDSYPSGGSLVLNAMDAGTDSGSTFTSPDQPMSDFDPISVFDQLSSSNIFYNEAEGILHPICTIRLVLNS